MTATLRRHAKRLVAIGVVLALYGFARLPEPSDAERQALAARFSFARLPLPVLPGDELRFVRAVNPSLRHLSAWISSVGAAVALHDLDGDGLPNDVCYVDTRTDRVIVAPAPGTPARYGAFSLEPTSLPYERATMAPMGCLPGDFNEDGLPDLLVYYWGRTPIAFLRRDASAGDARPLSADAYVGREVVPAGGRWFTNAATLADLDGDGHVDVVIGNYFPDGSRILDARAAEPDRMQHSMSRAFNGGGPRFLLGKGGTRGRDPHVVFQEVADVLEPDVARGWVLALGAADLDGDLLPEIYVANDFGPDRLLHNRSTPGRLSFARLEGKKTLFIPNSKVIGRDSFKGMGVDFGDLAGRGRLDIYVSNIATEYALEESHFVWMNTGAVHRMRDGVAPFVDESESLGLSRSGWGWDARFGDFDNDSVLEALQATGFVRGSVNRWPELHELAMGNDELLRHPASWLRVQPGDDLSGYARSPFFVRSPRGRYVDVAPQVGLGEPDVRRGIATADIDGDGRLDLAIAAQWDTSYVYRNTSPATGAFLGLHLRLPVAGPPAPTRTRAGHPIAEERSRPAIGAAATITLPDGRRMTAQVDGGNGHSGKRSPDLHFGLGALPAGSRLRVELAWRDAAGAVHRQTMELPAGWHTVMLGGGA